ncbi:MAG TPA: response regulator transcription factor [Vicinamibacterales bacterium]|nr:response regulator transcription factor [Vicinamibacterales bacterium]
MARILIVEDEPDIVLTLKEDLRRQGHTTGHAADGPRGLELALAGGWDLVVLDVMLPGMDGFDVCSELRRSNVPTPIIMLTARSGVTDKEVGLDAGADDYVTKPFNMRELRARIRAQLRRHSNGSDQAVAFGDCVVDFDRAELRRGGVAVEITPQELRLLRTLVRNRGRVMSREQLIASAWGHDAPVTDRVVDTHVWSLRRKVEPDPSTPRYLIGVRGLGYRFDDAN